MRQSTVDQISPIPLFALLHRPVFDRLVDWLGFVVADRTRWRRLDIFERRMRTGQQTTWTLTEGGALAKDAFSFEVIEHQRSSKKVSSALALQAYRQYITALFGKNKVS